MTMQATITPPRNDLKASPSEHQTSFEALEFDLDRVLGDSSQCSGGKTVKFKHSNGSEICGRIVQGTTQVAASSIADRTPEIHRAPCHISGTVTVEYKLNDRTHSTQMPVNRLIDLHDQLAVLEQECDRLIRAGLAEPGTWIEVEKVHKRNWRQAKWVASSPTFTSQRNPSAKLKTKYIGKENSPKHLAARALYANRKQYDKLTKQIESIKRRLGDV